MGQSADVSGRSIFSKDATHKSRVASRLDLDPESDWTEWTKSSRITNTLGIRFRKVCRSRHRQRCVRRFGPRFRVRGAPLFSTAGEVNFVFISILLLHWFLRGSCVGSASPIAGFVPPGLWRRFVRVSTRIESGIVQPSSIGG